MARRPDREKAEILSEEDLKELRYNLSHLSEPAVRDFYERSHQGLPDRLQPAPEPQEDTDPRPGTETVMEVAVGGFASDHGFRIH